MATIRFSVSHTQTKAEALKRIKRLLQEAKKEHGHLVTGLKEKWEGNRGTFSFSAKGYTISGSINVDAPEIELEGEVPFALSFLSGKIKKMITTRAKELLM